MLSGRSEPKLKVWFQLHHVSIESTTVQDVEASRLSGGADMIKAKRRNDARHPAYPLFSADVFTCQLQGVKPSVQDEKTQGCMQHSRSLPSGFIELGLNFSFKREEKAFPYILPCGPDMNSWFSIVLVENEYMRSYYLEDQEMLESM